MKYVEVISNNLEKVLKESIVDIMALDHLYEDVEEAMDMMLDIINIVNKYKEVEK